MCIIHKLYLQQVLLLHKNALITECDHVSLYCAHFFSQEYFQLDSLRLAKKDVAGAAFCKFPVWSILSHVTAGLYTILANTGQGYKT